MSVVGRRGPLTALLFAASLLASLGGAEAIVRWLRPQDLSGSWRIMSPRGYLLNRAGGSARHQFGHRVVRYRFNVQHLRGGPIAPGRRRVLVLGDSFTFGWLLPEDATIVAHLAAHASRDLPDAGLEFLNGGAAAWGTADYLAFLEEYGPTISPAIVLVIMNSDDIGRSIDHGVYLLGSTGTLSSRPETAGSTLASVKRLMTGPLFEWTLEHSHLAQLARNAVIRAVAPPAERTRGEGDAPEARARATRLGEALFRRLHEWCTAHRAALYVVTTGWQQWHFAHPEVFGDYRATQAFLEHAPEFFAREGIPFQDLTPQLVAEVGDRIESVDIPGDPHPNELGSALIAKHAWTWLRSRLAAPQPQRVSSRHPAIGPPPPPPPPSHRRDERPRLGVLSPEPGKKSLSAGSSHNQDAARAGIPWPHKEPKTTRTSATAMHSDPDPAALGTRPPSEQGNSARFVPAPTPTPRPGSRRAAQRSRTRSSAAPPPARPSSSPRRRGGSPASRTRGAGSRSTT